MNEFTFQTEIKVDDDDGKRDGQCTIKWSVEFECRSWGIKSVMITVPDQEFKGWLEKRDPMTEEVFDSQKESPSFLIKDVNVVSPFGPDCNCMGILCPQSIHISGGKFSVEFN